LTVTGFCDFYQPRGSGGRAKSLQFIEIQVLPRVGNENISTFQLTRVCLSPSISIEDGTLCVLKRIQTHANSNFRPKTSACTTWVVEKYDMVKLPRLLKINLEPF